MTCNRYMLKNGIPEYLAAIEEAVIEYDRLVTVEVESLKKIDNERPEDKLVRLEAAMYAKYNTAKCNTAMYAKDNAACQSEDDAQLWREEILSFRLVVRLVDSITFWRDEVLALGGTEEMLNEIRYRIDGVAVAARSTNSVWKTSSQVKG